MFKSNCHTHTNYCDGKNTAREMVEAAIERGFVSLGFSGHSPMKGKDSWTMSPDGVKDYMEEIRALKKEYSGRIDILCGIELDADYACVDPADFDFVIGSLHQLKRQGKAYDVDHTPEKLKMAANEFFGGSFDEMCKCYFATLADFIISTDVDVVGHFDLITKFNARTPLIDEESSSYQSCALAAVDRIIAAKPDVLFEVNTGGMFRAGKSAPYPAAFILRRISEKGGRVTVTSDCHRREGMDYAFDEAEKLLKDCGFGEIYYFTSQGIKKYSLN